MYTIQPLDEHDWRQVAQMQDAALLRIMCAMGMTCAAYGEIASRAIEHIERSQRAQSSTRRPASV